MFMTCLAWAMCDITPRRVPLRPKKRGGTTSPPNAYPKNLCRTSTPYYARTMGEAFKSSSAGVGSFICSLLRHRVGTSACSIAPTPVNEWGERTEGPLSAGGDGGYNGGERSKESETGPRKKAECAIFEIGIRLAFACFDANIR